MIHKLWVGVSKLESWLIAVLLPSPGARPLGDARRVARSVELAARDKRQSSGKETVETMVYIDKQTADFHGGTTKVETYVATLLNVVSGSVDIVETHCYVHAHVLLDTNGHLCRLVCEWVMYQLAKLFRML